MPSLNAPTTQGKPFVPAPSGEPATRPDASPAPPPDFAGVLPQLPGYEIFEELARGGMGVVYKARQLGANRVVALKMILLGGQAGPAERARFRTDAEALARLQHPGVVQIYEVGEHDGLPFFSMEFCSAGSLADYLDGTPLPVSEAVWLIATLAQAVQACHVKNVIHRDLKPANVLLQSPDSDPRRFHGHRVHEDARVEMLGVLHSANPKITDFGLAKNLNASAHTASNAILGTPSYMPPEQASSKHQQLGPPTDVYALGAILYEMLTGRPPFKAATVLDTILQVIQDDPVPPSHLQPRTPADLERICLKCLEKDPNKRYATARALADDLERFGRGEPVVARPLGRLLRSVRWIKRNRVVAALLAAVGATLVLGMAAATLLYLEAERRARALDVAVRQTQATARQERERRQEASLEREKAEKAQRLADERLEQSKWLVYAAQAALAQREWEAGNAGAAWLHLDACRLEFRGWEHRYLTTLFTWNQRTFVHSDPVACTAWSNDGEFLASGSADRTVKIWSARTGIVRNILLDPAAVISSVAFSPDGNHVAGAAGNSVILWNLTTGARQRLGGHTGKVASVAFRPDGKRLASGSADQSVRIWEVPGGGEALSLGLHKEPVTSVAFSPEGGLLATGSFDGSVRLWDAREFQLLNSIDTGAAVACLAFSHDGKRLAAGGGKMVRLWSTATGQPLAHPIKADNFTVTSVSFSRDGNWLLSTGREPIVKVWNTATGELYLALKGHGGSVSCGAFRPEGNQLATASADRTVKVWAVVRGEAERSLEAHKTAARSLAFSQDGASLATCGGEGTIKVWNVISDAPPMVLPGHAAEVNSVAFSPDGRILASGGADATVRLWDLRKGRLLRPALREHGDAVTSVQFSPDGGRLASASRDGTVKIWSVETGRLATSFRGHADAVTSLAFSRDGRLATSCVDGTLRLWDARTQRLLHSLSLRGDSITSVAFSVDGKWLISGGRGRLVRVHDAASGKLHLVLRGHTAAVTSVAASHDGRRLASGGEDRTVRLWDLATGQEVLVLRGHVEEVTSVAFSPDGQHLASAGEDGMVKLWVAGNTVDQRTPLILPRRKEARSPPREPGGTR